MNIPRLLFLLACAALLAGCVSGSRSGPLAGIDLPRGRDKVGPSLWMAAGQPGVPLEARAETLLPLPVVSAKNRLGIDEARRVADSSHYRMVALGVPYAYLPLEFSFSRAIYQPGTEAPTGRLVRRWSPLWSWSKVEGEIDDVLEVSGFPLLWEKGREAGPVWYFDDFATGFDERWEFEFFTLFWWIGPMDFDLRKTWTGEDGEPREVNSRFFAPLFLGRGPGFLLWSDFKESERGPEGLVTTRGHGPLLGWPLYRATRTLPAQGNPRIDRLVLGGLLWNDRIQRDETRQTSDSVHGPLWGAVGWGKKDGRPAVHVLWLPVRL
jgi:hypothetical protein